MISKKNLLRPLFLTCVFALSGCSTSGLSAEAQIDQAVAAYRHGQYAEAANILKKLAEKGYAKAQTKLGLLYYGGDGVKQDYTKARYWFEKAAAQGDADAQEALVMSRLEGH